VFVQVRVNKNIWEEYFLLEYVDSSAVTLLKRITSTLSVVLGAGTVYLIVCHSPRELKVYRWFLLALLVRVKLNCFKKIFRLVAIGFELQMFTLSDVVVFLPSPMFQTNGPLSKWLHIPAKYQMVRAQFHNLI